MAKTTDDRRARDAARDAQVQVLRVRRRLAGDEHWLDEIQRSTKTVEGLHRMVKAMLAQSANVRWKWSTRREREGREWREDVDEFAQDMQALARFAKLVGLTKKRRDAWDAFHVWVSDELKASRRRSSRRRDAR